MAVLDEALVQAEDGRGGLVFVSGDAGIGKTALVRGFCARVPESTRVLLGACDGLRTPRPLGPFADIVLDVGGRLGAAIASGEPVPAVFEALAGELASSAPTVVVLEDVHLADEATLDILGLMGRRVEQFGVLVLATYRSDELPRTHQLRVLLGDLATAPGVRRIRLDSLSRSAVADLAAPYGIDPDELHTKTGGNPFFVTEVLASGTPDVPATVRDAVLARAARLDERARDLLDAVAVVPQRTELWLLEAVTTVKPAALDDCFAAGMLQAENRAVTFRHELARIAVEESINPLRRTGLHGAVLHALRAAASTDLARLAYHAEAAGDSAAVLEFAPAAGAAAAAVGAHREAADQYARVLRFGGALPARERAELLERRSYECYLTTQDEAAEAATESALAIHRALGDRTREGKALLALARVLANAARVSEARRAAEEGIGLLERIGAARELPAAYAARAGFETLAEDGDQGRYWAEKAMAHGERGSVITLAVLDALRGSAEGRRTLETALADAVEQGRDNDAGRLYVVNGMGACRERSLDRMAGFVYPGLAFCQERDLPIWGRYLLSMRGWLELERCAWDAAAETATLVLAHRCTLSSVQARIVIALLRARRGDPDPWTPLAEADAVARETGQLWWLWQTAAARAEALWLSGRADGISAAVEETYRLALRLGSPWVVGDLACWRRRAGNDEEVRAEVSEPFRLQLSGEWRRAADRWWESGCPYEAAVALGESDDVELLSVAVEELDRLDARPAAALVRQRLAERGVRGPRSSTRRNPAGLTTRQLEVLELVVEGLRNAEIADRLVLSERTVEHHVAAILRKLGVRSRAEASAHAVRLGLDRPS